VLLLAMLPRREGRPAGRGNLLRSGPRRQRRLLSLPFRPRCRPPRLKPSGSPP